MPACERSDVDVLTDGMWRKRNGSDRRRRERTGGRKRGGSRGAGKACLYDILGRQDRV